MHAVVGSVTIHDFERGLPALQEEIMPRVKATPGLVGAYWLRSGAGRGMSMILLDSEDAATALAQMIQAEGPPTDAVTLNTIEVCEIVAHA